MAAAQDTADAQGGGGGGGEEGGTSLWVDAWASGDGPTLSKAEIDERCAGTKANWCRGYFLQPPIPAKPPPRGNKTCLWGCGRCLPLLLAPKAAMLPRLCCMLLRLPSRTWICMNSIQLTHRVAHHWR